MKTIKTHQLCLLFFFTALIAVQAQEGDGGPPAEAAPAAEAAPTQESNPPPQQAVQNEDKHARFSHRRFRGDLGIGVAYGDGTGAVTFGGEFKYAVIPNLYLGLGGSNVIHKDFTKNSFFAVGDYFFTEGLVRPYVGLGLGVIRYSKDGDFSSTNIFDDEDDDIRRTNDQTGLVLIPRVGVDIWHFRLGLAYEFEFSDDIPGFFAITAGAVFGGGKKSK